MTHPHGPATSLTSDQITALRDRANRKAGTIVDPHVLAKPVHNPEWASAVLGRPYLGERHVTWPERYLLHIAGQADPTPPPPPRATAARARQQEEWKAAEKATSDRRDRELREWNQLAAALHETTGVRVEVRHNYTSHRHLGHYSQGGDHIYLLSELVAGRLRRPAHRVLCWTPSRARDLREFPETATDGRTPSCKTCLRTAHRLTGRTS